MKLIWSYLLMALCVSMTSARIINFPSNRHGFHGNLISGVKDEKVLTPPSDDGLIIDSNGYPGNSNEGRVKDYEVEDLPPHFSEILAALFSQNKNSHYDLVPFSKEDIIKVQESTLCKMMCENGLEKPPCKC